MFTTMAHPNLKKFAAGIALLAATAGLGGCYYGPGYGPRYGYARPAYAAPYAEPAYAQPAYAQPAYAQPAYDYGAGYYAPGQPYDYAPYGGVSVAIGGGGYGGHRRGW